MPRYTSEKNIAILISLLKKHNIKYIVASPGSTNINFVASVQNDDFFKVFSSVDERSAAYIACGIAAESGEPVVITCTGATASRNYMPGLTEAYYRKLPVIALTASQHPGRIGQNIAQVLDRSAQPNDICKKSIQLNPVYTEEDSWDCNLKVNDILLECQRNGGGPVHINMITGYSNDFSSQNLPDEKKIDRITEYSVLPEIKESEIAVFIGNHKKFSDDEVKEIEEFCNKYNGVVLCDKTSKYFGEHRIEANIITDQKQRSQICNDISLLVDIGETTGAYMNLSPKKVWRVDPDGEIKDQFKATTAVFEMEEKSFFEHYNALRQETLNNTYYKTWKSKYDENEAKLSEQELPFSNSWVAQNIIPYLKDGDIVHLGILNSLRSWNYIDVPAKVDFYCNTGGFGIDGITSTAIGASLTTNKTVYCILGDLAFFYDLNSLGNREIKNNLKVILINNGCGTEFHNYNHRSKKISDEYNISLDFIAADGHYGKQSKVLVKHYVEDLGYKYLVAKDKKSFKDSVDAFFKQDGPIVFEIFTDPEKESEAIKMIQSIDVGAKSKIVDMVGEKNISRIKKIFGK